MTWYSTVLRSVPKRVIDPGASTVNFLFVLGVAPRHDDTTNATRRDAAMPTTWERTHHANHAARQTPHTHHSTVRRIISIADLGTFWKKCATHLGYR